MDSGTEGVPRYADIRIPGGRLRPDQLAALAEAADTDGNGTIEILTGGQVRLPDVPSASPVTTRLGETGLVPGTDAEPSPADARSPAGVGWFDQDDGAVTLVAVTPHGVLPARTAHFLAAVDRPIRVTSNRFIVIADLDEGSAETVVRVLAPMGLVFDAASPWAVPEDPQGDRIATTDGTGGPGAND